LVAIAAQALLAPGPARLHLDEQLEEHLRAEKPLEVLARFAGDPLDALAAGADHDRTLRLAVDDDRRVDASKPRQLLVALDLDRARVRQLVAELAEQLLADRLGGEEPLAAVGERVRLVQRRP